jgi:hypothetical protein
MCPLKGFALASCLSLLAWIPPEPASSQAELDAQTRALLLEAAIESAAQQMKLQLPIALDDITTLFDVSANASTIHQWIRIDNRYSDAEMEKFPEVTRAILLERVCNSSMSGLLEVGGSYHFHYLDQDNADLASVLIEPADC